MLFRVLRTQTTKDGTLRAGVAYDARQNKALAATGQSMIAKGFAVKVTDKDLKAAAAPAAVPEKAG